MVTDNLILLHGALGASTQYHQLLPLLREKIETHTLDFEGHGSSKLKDRPFRIEHFAENVLAYMDQYRLSSAYIFGHSLGGHVGLYLAKHHPGRVAGVFTFALKLHWTPEIAEKENQMLNAEKMMEKVPHFVETLKNRHQQADWIALLDRVKEMHTYIGSHPPFSDHDMSALDKRVRVAMGDRDKMVTIEETLRVYRLLKMGEFQIFPKTEHPLEKISMSSLANAILDFADTSL